MGERQFFAFQEPRDEDAQGALRVEHRFAVANSSWSNGTCERIVREVVRALQALLQEEKCDIASR